MEFVAGVMVFPGGGVDDRDRNADIAWFGPEPGWWAERFGVAPDLAEALGRWAGGENLEERVEGVEQLDPVVLAALRSK